MIRPAVLLSVLAVTVASLVSAPTAQAGDAIYRHFRLRNPNTRSFNFDISWDNGRTWESASISAESRSLRWNTDEGVTPKIRFDADLTNGIAWRTYTLELTRSNYKPNQYTDTHVYRFVVVGGSMLDLRRE